MTSPITFTGPVTVNITLDVPALASLVTGPIIQRINDMEDTLMSQFTDLRDELQGVFADLAAKIDRLQAAVDNADSATHLTDEDQALLDEITATVAAARGTVGDENADGIPSA